MWSDGPIDDSKERIRAMDTNGRNVVTWVNVNAAGNSFLALFIYGDTIYAADTMA